MRLPYNTSSTQDEALKEVESVFFYDFKYLLFISPAILLAFLAQALVMSAYGRGKRIAARTSGADAARRILDSAGLTDVGIEQVGGVMSDHYDPTARVLRLSPEVYHGESLTAVGIAAHEAGHALQHAQGYLALGLRNMAVPLANFGSGIGMVLLLIGIGFHLKALALVGLILFGSVAAFQIINLPVEFNASSRAKAELVGLGIVSNHDMGPVNRVLNAAALTYVAATLQSILSVLYYASYVFGGSSSRDE